MSRVPAQLSLGVGLRDDSTFSNFHPGANAALVDHLKRQLEDDGESFLYLWGLPGSGRSHLLQAACHAASERDLRTLYLPLDDLGHFPPLMLEDVERLDLVAIDDLERVIGRRRWEEGLFHAFNRLRDSGRRLVISSDRPPRQLEVTLPDLASRLSWGVTFHLTMPGDEDRMCALQLRAGLRGMQLSDEVARYILHRGSRQLGELLRCLETLDSESLSAQRKLTIPFVKKVLDW